MTEKRNERWELRATPELTIDNTIANNKLALNKIFADSDERDFLNILDRRANLEDLTVFVPAGVCARANRPQWHEAAVIVEQAITDKTPICIYGDYDVDGMTATATLYTCLQRAGANVSWYIPSRTEGYGLHTKPFEGQKPCLIITVDTGITAVDEVKELNDKGFKVLVTDHHLPGEKLPEAVYILNPKVLLPEGNDEYMASGCYVAAKLGLFILRDLDIDDTDIQVYCDALTAMSINSDMIPLNPTMRRQLSYGLTALGITKHIGLRALLNICNYNAIFDPNVFLVSGTNRPITSNFLSFMVVPKLNSAGRMDSIPTGMAPLLFQSDPKKSYSQNMIDATSVAIKLQTLNQQRKVVENAICAEALNQAYEYIGSQIAEFPPAVVVYGKDWKVGVIGIVAAKLCDIFGVITIVLSGEGDTVRGSGRAPEGADLYGALTKCKDLLVQFGGHRAAAGVTIKQKNIEAFRTKLVEVLKEEGANTELVRKYDARVNIPNLHDIRLQTYVIEAVEPTGVDNEPLVLLLPDVKVCSTSVNRETSQMIVCQKDKSEVNLFVKRFRSPIDFSEWLNQDVDLLVTPDMTYYNGTTNLGYTLVSIRKHVKE